MNRLKYTYILFSIAIIFSSCSNHSTSDNRKPVKVCVEVVADSLYTSNTQYSHSYMGEIEESSSASLNFIFGGQITEILVKEGDKVSQGQVLMCVDATEAKASLSSASAQLQQAQDAFNRVKQVYEQGGVSEIKWVEVQTQLAQAQSVYDIAHKNASNRTLTAPFSGVVGEVNGSVGDHLLPGQTAVKILNINSLCVSFAVPEADINSINTGDKISIYCESVQKNCDGTITEKSMIANRLSRTYKVKATLNDKEQKLLSGMNCKIDIAQTNFKGFIVPAHAVQTHQNGKTLWIVRNGHAQRINVETGNFVNNGVLITGSLSSGDTVIVSGYQKLYNDAAVIIE